MKAAELETRPADAAAVGGAYPRYVLGVLVLVYVLNFLDRNILSILNEEIKRDLGLTDAQMGFLYGTAFAVFYALFGIPLGRLADVWTRRSLIAVGLAFWSVMTAASAFTRSFAQLAAARIGVGVGEASASPAAFSLLSDCFAPVRRATVLAIYSSGIYIGAGLGLLIGGQVVERWDRAFPGGSGPLGLNGWRAAFLVVGLPGLLLALWVRTLREPVRGQADGLMATAEAHPFREFLRELVAVLPVLATLHLCQAGTRRDVARNLVAAGLVAAAVWLLVVVTGDTAQWCALGVGVHATFSWTQALALRDRPTAALVFGTPSLLYAGIGLAFLAFTGYGLGYWIPPFFIRTHGVPPSEVGFVLGGAAAAGGWLGVTLGGILADAMRRRRPDGRLRVALVTALLPLPVAAWLLTTGSLAVAYALAFPLNVLSSLWIGAGASTVQDLVLPRMRASASAFYLLLITFIGLALGPYTIGKLADLTGSIRTAMLLGLGANAIAFGFVLLAMRTLARDEATLRERVRGAGEPGL